MLSLELKSVGRGCEFKSLPYLLEAGLSSGWPPSLTWEWGHCCFVRQVELKVKWLMIAKFFGGGGGAVVSHVTMLTFIILSFSSSDRRPPEVGIKDTWLILCG